MRKVVVDEDKLLSIIDQMRVSIPDEIKKAQQLLSQRDRLIAQGQEEANRTLQIAREKASESNGSLSTEDYKEVSMILLHKLLILLHHP